MNGLNLAGLKKLKEDAQSATLIHKDGHLITIAKAPLGDFARKQIASMQKHPHFDEGGEVQDDNSGEPASDDEVAPVDPDLAQTVEQESGGQNTSRGPAGFLDALNPNVANDLVSPNKPDLIVPSAPFQQGPGLPRYIDQSQGLGAGGGSLKVPWDNGTSSRTPAPPKDSSVVKKGKRPFKKSSGDDDQPPHAVPSRKIKMPPLEIESIPSDNNSGGSGDGGDGSRTPNPQPSVSGSMGPPGPPGSNGANGAAGPGANVNITNNPSFGAPNAQGGAGGASSSTGSNFNPYQFPTGGLEDQQAANTAMATAQTDWGNKEAQGRDDFQKGMDNLPTQSDIVAANQQKDQALMASYKNGQIDPDHYWQNHGKVATGLGLIFSGIGHTLPTAMNYLGHAIDQDIDAQKFNNGNKLNLWKMNRAALGSDLEADLATKKQMMLGLQNNIDNFAAQARGPIAAAQAQQANGIIKHEIDKNNAITSVMHGPTSDAMEPEQKISALQRLGVNIPQGDLSAISDEIKGRRDTLQALPHALDAFERASKEARPMRGGLGGTSINAIRPQAKTPAQAQLGAIIGTTVARKEKSVAQARFDSLEDAFTPAFADKDSTVGRRRDEMLKYFGSNTDAPVSKRYGIDLDKYPSTSIKGYTDNYYKKRASDAAAAEAVKNTGHTTDKKPPPGYERIRTPRGTLIDVPIKQKVPG